MEYSGSGPSGVWILTARPLKQGISKNLFPLRPGICTFWGAAGVSEWEKAGVQVSPHPTLAGYVKPLLHQLQRPAGQLP